MQQFLSCRLTNCVVSLPGLDIISQDHEFLTAGNCLVPLIDGLVLTKVIIYYMMIVAHANDCTFKWTAATAYTYMLDWSEPAWVLQRHCPAAALAVHVHGKSYWAGSKVTKSYVCLCQKNVDVVMRALLLLKDFLSSQQPAQAEGDSPESNGTPVGPMYGTISTKSIFFSLMQYVCMSYLKLLWMPSNLGASQACKQSESRSSELSYAMAVLLQWPSCWQPL